MELRIEHEGFCRQRLSVRRGNFFRDPALLLDGARVRKTRGRYTIADDTGMERSVRLRTNPFDPIPRVELDGKRIQLAPPLRRSEIALALSPVLLLLVGGALGGAIGLTAAYLNFAVLRSSARKAEKLLLAVFILIAATATVLVAGLLVAWLLFGDLGHLFRGRHLLLG